ncbi:MAG: tetratricopeptide repeat protein [Candidatus Hydrogenedentota bacterium]
MSEAEQDKQPREPGAGEPAGLLRATVVLTAVALIAFLGGTALYVHLGGGMVNALDEELGEILMQRGMRFEKAGQLENAKATYREALECTFTGPQNRADTLKHLGVLYWNEHEYAKALPLLREAVSFDPPPMSAFEPLADCLYQLGRFEAAETLLDRWQRRAGDLGHAGQIARAKYYEGMIALEHGATQDAIEAFRAGVEHVPGGRNASQLGVLYYEASQYDKALTYIDQYLETGTGNRAQYMRQLRKRALERRAAP